MERFFAPAKVTDTNHLVSGSGKTAADMPLGRPASLAKRHQFSTVDVNGTAVNPNGPAGCGDAGAEGKDVEWDMDVPEALGQGKEHMEEHEQEAQALAKAIAMERDLDEEEEWTELAMTIRLCLASAAPAEIMLEERIRKVIECSSTSDSKSDTFSDQHIQLVPVSAVGPFASQLSSGSATPSPASSPSRDASADERLRVAASLAASRQHDVVLCHAAWPTSHDSPSGEYDFLEISAPSGSPTSVLASSTFSDRITSNLKRVVVDVSFRQQFEIARPTPRYAQLLAQIPTVFVGVRQRLRPLVTAMATALNLSLESSGMSIAPWRRAKYLTSKWFPTSDIGNAIPEARTAVLPMASDPSSPPITFPASVVPAAAAGLFENKLKPIRGESMLPSGRPSVAGSAVAAGAAANIASGQRPAASATKHLASTRPGSLSLSLRLQERKQRESKATPALRLVAAVV